MYASLTLSLALEKTELSSLELLVERCSSQESGEVSPDESESRPLEKPFPITSYAVLQSYSSSLELAEAPPVVDVVRDDVSKYLPLAGILNSESMLSEYDSLSEVSSAVLSFTELSSLTSSSKTLALTRAIIAVPKYTSFGSTLCSS